MEQLTVTVLNHRYDVHIGRDTYTLFKTQYAELLTSADRIGIIVDENVAGLHLSSLVDALQDVKSKIAVNVVPAGEKCKSSAVYVDCQSFLVRENFTRNSLLIAFGGGACGDLTGFVAATYMRGIRYIQCPTTILAHDSAVGGKTAINLPEGKNMVGAFHQPQAVLFNSTLLETLPPREIRSGLAELVKHALISDKEWSKQLVSTQAFMSPTVDWLTHELLKGIQVKAKIVEEDEFEQSTRKFLNFGHTFGHAVEAVCGFGGLSHGESVMIGMTYSLVLSETKGKIKKELTNQFINFSLENGYSYTPIFDYTFDEFMRYMEKDKKVTNGEMNFVLLEELSTPFLAEVTRMECEQALDELRKRLGRDVN